MTEKNLSSRRGFLKGSLAATAASPIAALGHTMSSLAMTSLESPFFSILRLPDLVRAFGPDGEIKLNHNPAQETWSGSGVEISFHLTGTELTTSLTSRGKVSRVQLRWHGNLRAATHFLGDHWERSYADLEWRGEAAGRTMPWYFLASDGKRTHGYGVKTGAGALCFWNADSQGISLWLDVRSGGVPVELGDRKLLMAEILEVSSPGSAFQTAQIPVPKNVSESSAAI